MVKYVLLAYDEITVGDLVWLDYTYFYQAEWVPVEILNKKNHKVEVKIITGSATFWVDVNHLFKKRIS